METLVLLTKIFGISFTSGINLYATVAIVGAAVRFDLIKNLPDQLEVLGNEYVICVAAVMYLCEFFADKIPAFDSIWDGVHTFIRPLAAAFIALMAVGDAPLYIKIIAFLVAGSVALTSHSAKTGIRLIANTSPEPVSNSVLSVVEDIGVFALLALILTHPFVAAGIVAILLILIIWQGPKLIDFIIFMIKALNYKLLSLFPGDKFINVEIIPEKYNNYLNEILETGEKVYLTVNSNFKGAVKTNGYLIATSKRTLIIYKSWFSFNHFDCDNSKIKRMTFQNSLLVDKISFIYDSKQFNTVLFKSNNRSIADLKNIFKSLDIDIVEPETKLSISTVEAD